MALHKESHGALIGVIGDEDTVTGFLLAGVGNMDARRKSNFLIVDSSEFSLPSSLPPPSPLLPSYPPKHAQSAKGRRRHLESPLSHSARGEKTYKMESEVNGGSQQSLFREGSKLTRQLPHPNLLLLFFIPSPPTTTTTTTTTTETTKKAIEDAFKDLTSREDIAVVLISQYVAEMIRYLVNEYTQPIPAVLEIPSKDNPYDATKDSILARVQHLMGTH